MASGEWEGGRRVCYRPPLLWESFRKPGWATVLSPWVWTLAGWGRLGVVARSAPCTQGGPVRLVTHVRPLEQPTHAPNGAGPGAWGVKLSPTKIPERHSGWDPQPTGRDRVKKFLHTRTPPQAHRGQQKHEALTRCSADPRPPQTPMRLGPGPGQSQ